MFKSLRFIRRTDRRKYPIKKNAYFQSARKQAFEEFDKGKRPAEIILAVDISLKTAYRYFADWKKRPENLNFRYDMLRYRMKNDSGFSDLVVDRLVECLGIPREEVIERLSKPWAIKQFISGKWPNLKKKRIQNEQESRLYAALDIINLLEHRGIPPDEVRAKLKNIIDDALKKQDN